jgi:hypothetical protein
VIRIRRKSIFRGAPVTSDLSSASILFRAELPTDGHDKALRQYRKTRRQKLNLVRDIPGEVFRWWLTKHRDAVGQYMGGGDCSCGFPRPYYTHGHDVCYSRFIDVWSESSYTEATMAISHMYTDGSLFAKYREFKFVSVPQELEEQLSATHSARKRCIAVLPSSAKQFWRNSSRKKYQVLLRNIVEQSAIASLAYYIAQNY